MLHAEEATDILQLVLAQNKTLLAATDHMALAKQQVLAENALDDPEIGFDYLWGKPGFIGHRKDVSINQRLDLATLFGYRRRLVHSQQELIELEMYQQYMTKRLEATDLMAELTYYNQAIQLYDEHLTQQRQLVTSYERRLQSGDASKLDVNRIHLAVAEVEAEAERCHTERDLLLLQLQSLCGASSVTYTSTDYKQLTSLPTVTSLQAIQAEYSQKQQQIAEAGVKAARAEALPSLTVGYMAELTHDEKWRGVTLGVSIPLWSGSRNVRLARLQQQSARSEAEEAAYQLEQQTQAQRLRTERYQAIAQRIHQQLADASQSTLLQRALHEGEISLTDYLIECSDLFQLRLKALEAERDYQQALLCYEAIR